MSQNATSAFFQRAKSDNVETHPTKQLFVAIISENTLEMGKT